jgi:aspartate/methionine/tyrosine aminotransferase
MSSHISKFAKSLGESTIVGMRRQADALEKSGVNIVDFGAGEPDFGVPTAIKKAAIRAIENDHSHYIDPRGLIELRDLIARNESDQQGRTVDPEQIVVTAGTLGALSLLTRAILNPGDEVIIIEPRWGPYRNMVMLTGAVPVGVPMGSNGGRFILDAERIAAAVSSKTVAIIVNTPCNPTGRVLSTAELTEVADLAKRHDLWIIADEVYSGIVFAENEHVSVASLGDNVADRTIVATSLSKSLAMTGWRLGYCIAPSHIAPLLARINHYSTRCASSIVQHAAITAIKDGATFIDDMCHEYSRRRDVIAAGLNQIDGIVCPVPEGTFYAFPGFPERWGDSRDVASRILQETGVIVTPGSAYGSCSRHHLRLSFATSMAAIEDGLLRLQKALPEHYD